MSTEIKSPTFPESVSDGTITNWVKQEGDTAKQDQVIAEIETDKVVLEVVAPFDGKITKILKSEGETVNSAEIIARFEKDNTATDTQDPQLESEISEPEKIETSSKQPSSHKTESSKPSKVKHAPSVSQLLRENNLDETNIVPSGKGGRLTKADVIKHLKTLNTKEEKISVSKQINESGIRHEERVAMSRLRSTIAKRLLDVKQETAMLTTFNEVDMQPIKNLRKDYGEEFESEHGIKLGYMGFFVSASCKALKKFPLVNASIDGDDIVYHGYRDIGVAVSTDRGLVVPIIKDCDDLSIPEIEKSINSLAAKARDGKLSIEDMKGGTFTISNGGIFGSLLSTPILNAPQTAILGMHKIEDRPVAIDGKVQIRPMMYLAMSYDHRLIDGKEAVTFLVTIKEMLESPERLLLNL